MRRVPLALILLAAACRVPAVPIPDAEATRIERAIREANPGVEGLRARGTLTVEGDTWLPIGRAREFELHAAAAPGAVFTLLRHPFGTLVKAGARDGEMWAVVGNPPSAFHRRPLSSNEGPAVVRLARDLLLALDLCAPIPESLALARRGDEILATSEGTTFAFEATTLRLRRRESPDLVIERFGEDAVPRTLVFRGRRLRERGTIRFESVEAGTPPPPETFEPGPVEGVPSKDADA